MYNTIKDSQLAIREGGLMAELRLIRLEKERRLKLSDKDREIYRDKKQGIVQLKTIEA